MTTEEVCETINEAVGEHEGDEKDLLGELMDIAEGWRMRLEEIEEEEKDECTNTGA
jgi:hypothetical protein